MAKLTISETFAWKVVAYLRVVGLGEPDSMASNLEGRLRGLDQRLRQRGVRDPDFQMPPAESRKFGQPGVRDPDFPCEAFTPGKPGGDCETDGHYMCDECVECKPFVCGVCDAEYETRDEMNDCENAHSDEEDARTVDEREQ